MSTVYLDCPSGISGDMMLGALVDTGISLAHIQAGIDSLELPSCQLVAEEVKRRGFRATKVNVVHEPEHAHRHLHHITEMIDGSRLSDKQKDLAKRIFTRLGEAEAKVHGTTIRKVHFHEVGAVDSIADIVGTAIGWDLLEATRMVSSPLPTGSGFIQIAHGRCSVPAPATAELLKGIPLASSTVEAELTTPTGAAIVATLADLFGPLPAMTIDRIGLGAGDRDLEQQANVVRLLVGSATDRIVSDQVWLLETNLDDISGELIGHAMSMLEDAGALDVHITPVQMKKNRPGAKISILCLPEKLPEMETILFTQTGTLGVRRQLVERHKLVRTEHQVETPWGQIAGKLAKMPDGTTRFTPEFESCRQVAHQHSVPLERIYEVARRSFQTNDS